MFKLLSLKWKKELEELESLHRIELAEKDAELRRREDDLNSAHDIKKRETISLLRLDSEQKIKQMELDHKRAISDSAINNQKELLKFKEDLLVDFNKRLTDAMTKLHEEGNLTTKFTQDLALKMLEAVPTAKSQVKLISHDRADKEI